MQIFNSKFFFFKKKKLINWQCTFIVVMCVDLDLVNMRTMPCVWLLWPLHFPIGHCCYLDPRDWTRMRAQCNRCIGIASTVLLQKQHCMSQLFEVTQLACYGFQAIRCGKQEVGDCMQQWEWNSSTHIATNCGYIEEPCMTNSTCKLRCPNHVVCVTCQL